MGERHKVHIDGEQHEFDGHQEDDHVTPIQEDANHTNRE
jgi:hypothetical protein